MSSRKDFRDAGRNLCGRNSSNHINKGVVPRVGFMFSANLELMEHFVDFCKAKNVNIPNGAVQGDNGLCSDRENDGVDSTLFREDLNMYFGDQLPSNVVDNLCKLVHESSFGKCSFCRMPNENLVLSVLQILSDGANIRNQLIQNNDVPPLANANLRVNNNAPKASKEPPKIYSQEYMKPTGLWPPQPTKCTRVAINGCSGERKNGNLNVSVENISRAAIVDSNLISNGPHNPTSARGLQ